MRSNCCTATVWEDTDICSKCMEHCDVIEECKYCGDEMQSLSHDEFCSTDCWNGYAHETFRKD